MKKEKVCLIIPPSLFLLDERVFPSLGILKIASSLEERNHPVEVLDLSGFSNYEDIVELHCKNTDSVIFGITATTPQMPATTKILNKIKKINKDFCVVLGGPHITLICAALKYEKKNKKIGRAHKEYDNLLKKYDIVVAGDGEDSIFEVIKESKNKHKFPLMIDADDPKGNLFMTEKRYEETPFPARHLIDLESYKYKVAGKKATSLLKQLGCPYQCNFCLSADTFIPTEKGLIKIGDLDDGKKGIKNFNVKLYSENGIAETSHIINQGVLPTKKITLKNGLSIVCSHNHKLKVVEDGKIIWREAKDINKEHWFPIVKVNEKLFPKEYIKLIYDKYEDRSVNSGNFSSKKFKFPHILNEDLSWILGFFVGDGLQNRDGITFAIDKKCKSLLIEKVKNCFDYNLKIYPIKSTNLCDYSVQIRNFLKKSLGVDFKNKHKVPDVIFKSPKSVIEAFLKGLWDADGNKSPVGEDYLTTFNAELANEINNLLVYIGKKCSIDKIYNKEKKKYYYRVYNNRKWNMIPCNKSIYYKRNGKIGWRKTAQKNRKHVSLENIKKIEPNHSLLINDCYYVPLLKISEGIPQTLYDFTVPGPENFIGNGLINHNCGGRKSPMLRRIRARSSDVILKEIKFLYERYGYKGFMIYDDELNIRNDEIIQFMNDISDLQEELGVDFRLRGFVKAELFNEEQANSMYRAGFRQLLTGFESGSEKILINIDKKATKYQNTKAIEIAKKHNMTVKALMSIGHAGESHKTIEDTKNWLLDVQPEDFDCTIITTYPGTSYYDESVETKPGIWTFTHKKTKDKLHSYELDYNETADYYKGDPSLEGGYKSYVFTDFITSEELVKERDSLEREVRKKLNIPFNPSAESVNFEHSMGQGPLPENILRISKIKKINKPKTFLNVIPK